MPVRAILLVGALLVVACASSSSSRKETAQEMSVSHTDEKTPSEKEGRMEAEPAEITSFSVLEASGKNGFKSAEQLKALARNVPVGEGPDEQSVLAVLIGSSDLTSTLSFLGARIPGLVASEVVPAQVSQYRVMEVLPGEHWIECFLDVDGLVELAEREEVLRFEPAGAQVEPAQVQD